MDGHKGELSGVLTRSPDGQYLVSADLAFHNPLIILWDLKTGEQLKVFVITSYSIHYTKLYEVFI